MTSRKRRSPADEPEREILEVEDDPTRQSRIGRLLAAQNDSSRAVKKPRTFSEHFNQPPSAKDGSLSFIPPTDLLGRLEAFLPQLKASNELLQERAAIDPQSVDIEHLGPAEDGADAQHIELNLGLGVFEKKRSSDDDEADTDSTDSDDEEDAASAPESSTADPASVPGSSSGSREGAAEAATALSGKRRDNSGLPLITPSKP